MKEITFVLTSCGRFELLEKTISSFITNNTYPIKKYLIIEDSGNKEVLLLKNKFPFLDIVINTEKLGQMKSIDKIYSMVDTEYIFHCEDDWLFHRSGFIEKSLDILEENKNILQVWIRNTSDHGHPLLQQTYTTRNNTSFKELLPMWNGIYSGFSFNPGLRRKSDYNLISPFNDIGGETRVGIVYSKMNFKFVSLLEGYCYHIGGNDHVDDPELIKNREKYYNFDVGDVSKYVKK